MRKLIFAINLTTDGCCDHTKLMPGDDLYEYHGDLLRGVDTLLYGRITYQLMIPFWPDMAKNQSGDTNAENEFARAFNSVSNIVVFSQSLNNVEEKNTRIIRTNLVDEILALKQEQGKDILTGGVDIPTQLIQAGLVDEYRFVIQPIIVGEGRRLLDGISLQEKLPLKLAASKVFPSGIIALRYVKS